jgi:hypothetical protein
MILTILQRGSLIQNYKLILTATFLLRVKYSEMTRLTFTFFKISRLIRCHTWNYLQNLKSFVGLIAQILLNSTET